MPKSGAPLCRLGLATRGTSRLTSEDVQHAIDKGVNFPNWCGGRGDGLTQAVAQLGSRRQDVFVCVQFEARSASAAEIELGAILRELRSDYVDALTFYYVEEPAEWEQIIAAGGAMEFCRQAVHAGKVRYIGLTTHQRPLAADLAKSGLLDFLMIRYNAAHRGAEQDVFPTTDRLGMPVVVYTCLRWGALLEATPDDPPGFVVPQAAEWYRFASAPPSVAVAVMAPENRAELDEDLCALNAGALTPAEFEALATHGKRVRRHAGSFP